jgi:DNA-binding transcriptional ArsR family regulator
VRIQGILILIAALAAVPTALAVEEVSVAVPDASVHVDGTTVIVPEATDLPVQIVGKVEVKDTDVSLSETRCTASTGLTMKDHADSAPTCTPGALTTGPADEIVSYDLDIVLPESVPASGPAGPSTLGAPAAIVDVVPASPAVIVAAAAAGASMLGLYAVWRVLKWTGLAAFLPLYSHITDDEILDDPNRAGIYRLIQAEPGISTKDVADRLDLAWGTVTHHLGKLEKRRFVVSKKYGKYRRYFANGAGGVQEKDALAVLRLDRTGDVAELIRTQPGMTQKAVSQVLGVSSSTILWHVKRLEEVNLVRKVREGKLVRYYPGEGMQGVAVIPAAPPATAA